MLLRPTISFTLSLSFSRGSTTHTYEDVFWWFQDVNKLFIMVTMFFLSFWQVRGVRGKFMLHTTYNFLQLSSSPPTLIWCGGREIPSECYSLPYAGTFLTERACSCVKRVGEREVGNENVLQFYLIRRKALSQYDTRTQQPFIVHFISFLSAFDIW